MSAVILVIHVMLAIALVATVLLQRSEGGALGMGGGGMGGFMTGRATANLLSRTTAVLATCFMLTSLLLAYLGGIERKPVSILEVPTATQPAAQPAVPAGESTPAAPAPSEKPSEPEVPIAK
ncbi:MAG TPA: preprotein translocase subunit SecG [Alphaproteobacteria bacterium]|jgi:preprotein translocase subunit SecG|nr:preprotein translocase subunit SecG [Alphaproteobacteria bacterium]